MWVSPGVEVNDFGVESFMLPLSTVVNFKLMD